MLGREMKDVLVVGVGQKGASLAQRTQITLVEGHSVESGHEFADVQAPMSVQVVKNPMKASLVGEVRGDMGQMGGEIHAGACHAQSPTRPCPWQR